jgi:hypothetical protein
MAGREGDHEETVELDQWFKVTCSREGLEKSDGARMAAPAELHSSFSR